MPHIDTAKVRLNSDLLFSQLGGHKTPPTIDPLGRGLQVSSQMPSLTAHPGRFGHVNDSQEEGLESRRPVIVRK
jgi:hypothetical protein